MSPSPIKKVAAVHDLSCIGRCSLTVILPILSCMGVQVCPLPTAVLSTHPGGYSGVSLCDFTRYMPDFAAHWRREDIRFDCIYSGFLASAEQIGVVSQFIDDFSLNHPLVLVDPIMGDDGKLYSICTDTMKEGIKALVQKADLITPNYTEACFLLGEAWQPVVEQVESLKSWLVRLSEMGPPRVVVTGVPLPGNKIANLGYDRDQDQVWQFTSDLIPARYPGTGDIFASVLLGKLLGGASLPEAIPHAGDFVSAVVQDTFTAGTPTREGILLENRLPQLCCDNLGKKRVVGGKDL
jgi:pyridoxine kinase